MCVHRGPHGMNRTRTRSAIPQSLTVNIIACGTEAVCSLSLGRPSLGRIERVCHIAWSGNSGRGPWTTPDVVLLGLTFVGLRGDHWVHWPSQSTRPQRQPMRRRCPRLVVQGTCTVPAAVQPPHLACTRLCSTVRLRPEATLHRRLPFGGAPASSVVLPAAWHMALGPFPARTSMRVFGPWQAFVGVPTTGPDGP